MQENYDENVLVLKGVCKEFPGVKALADVDLTIRRGEVHALVGENGAGKSTLMKILSGAYKKDGGTILFNGREVEIGTPKAAEKIGISIIHQELNLMGSLTVAENIFLGRQPRSRGIVQWKKMFDDAQALFQRLGIDEDVRSPVCELSIARQQMVEIAKAVSVDAKVVIMDEPTSSLTSRETEILFSIIGTLKEQGVAVIFITHRLEEIFRVADRLTVLRDGCYIGTREVKETTKDELIAMMIGRELTQQFPARNAEIGEVCLKVEHLSDGRRVRDVSFEVRPGEVVALIGANGAGKSTTLKTVSGMMHSRTGSIEFLGEDITHTPSHNLVYKGLAHVPEGRRIFQQMTVLENLEMGAYLHKKPTREELKDIFTRFPRLQERRDQVAGTLSGGEQQMLAMGRALISHPKLLMLDEPSMGLAPILVGQIFAIIRELHQSGTTILLVEQNAEMALQVADRAYVLESGKIALSGTGRELAESDSIKKAYLGG